MAAGIEEFGIIRWDWAVDLAKNGSDSIWEYNSLNAEEILNEIDLAELGALLVWLSIKSGPITPEQRQEIRIQRTIIDLAFEEPSYVTTTSKLLQSAELFRGDKSRFTIALRERSQPTDLHGGNEAWHIPTRAVQSLEPLSKG
jgi:hypothetical protein